MAATFHDAVDGEKRRMQQLIRELGITVSMRDDVWPRVRKIRQERFEMSGRWPIPITVRRLGRHRNYSGYTWSRLYKFWITANFLSEVLNRAEGIQGELRRRENVRGS